MAISTARRQKKIVEAIRAGFGRDVTRTEEDHPNVKIYVEGFKDPIIVEPNDVEVPECLAYARAGIRLDVQTIRAGL